MRKIDLSKREIDEKELIQYGFIRRGDAFLLKKHLPSFPFSASYILKGETLESRLIDDDSEEEYELVDAKSGMQGYSRGVNEEYQALTEEILSSCTKRIKTQTERIVLYVANHYGDKIEHLFEKSPEVIVIRKKENRKWYCLFMRIEAKKLSLNEKQNFDVLDLRGREQRILSIDRELTFPGFHMNKKHWYTIILDERMKDEEIISLIEESYSLAK